MWWCNAYGTRVICFVLSPQLTATIFVHVCVCRKHVSDTTVGAPPHVLLPVCGKTAFDCMFIGITRERI